MRTTLLGWCLGIVGLALIAVACGSDPTATSVPGGRLVGRVTIGPLCPVEPFSGSTQDRYSSRQLILQPRDGGALRLTLGPDGLFDAAVPAGSYTADLSDCVFLTCDQVLPKSIGVAVGKTATLAIDIDTGIR
jgi:hypothetical protein